jgi:trigger factor
MKSSVETVSPVERKIHVEIEPERVLKELDAAYRNLGTKVKVEGFRAGKVPRHVLERRYKAQVEADVAQNLVERSYMEVVREQKLDVVSSPRVDEALVLKVGETFKYDARVEVRPIIEPKDYLGLAVKRGKHAVDGGKVDEEIEKLRRNAATKVPVTDRDEAHAGDYATIDFEALIEGKPFTGNKAEGTTVEIAEGDFVEGKVAQIAGMKLGAQKTLDYTFPADFRISEAAGKLAQITFTLKALQKNELPALDDALAKEAGLGETVAEMRTKIEEILNQNAKSERDRETRTAIVQGLISHNPFDCPQAMIERGVESMVQNGVERLAQQGIDARQLGLDLDSLRKDMLPKAEEEVRGTLLLEAVAKKENIAPTEAEFTARLEQIAKENNIPLEKVQPIFKRPEQREGLMLRLREEKTLAFLESRAKLEES